MSHFLSNVGGFAQGFGQGLWGGVRGTAEGLEALAEGAYGLATDPNARAQAWNDAVNAARTAEWAFENPGEAAAAVGRGVTNVYDNFVAAEQQAVANGQGAQFWGNVVGQGAFAAGTVVLPGLAVGKLAGAAGELGDATQLARTAAALEEATPALNSAARAAEAAAPVLPNPDALSFVAENSGVARSAPGQAWRDYQAQTIGADYDPLTGRGNVPALRFDNPNPKGKPYVKWDGYQTLPDGTTELIEAKTAIAVQNSKGPFVPQKVLKQLDNKSAALDQNPGYRGVIEVPSEQVAADAQALLDANGIENIGVRVRPFQDAAAPISELAADALPADAAATPLAALDPALEAAAASPTATDGSSLLNSGSRFGAGLLGAGALGNVLPPFAPADPVADATSSSQSLYGVTSGVGPDGLPTTPPPTLESPGDTSIAPAPAIDAAPADPAPADPLPAAPDPGVSLDSGADTIDFSRVDEGGAGGDGGFVDSMAGMELD